MATQPHRSKNPHAEERDEDDRDARGEHGSSLHHAPATKAKASEQAVAPGSSAMQEAGAEGDDEDADDEQQAMMAAMGFGGFGSTKGKKVDGNQAGYAEVRKERTWRQYMQRKGGFNRPLSPVRK